MIHQADLVVGMGFPRPVHLDWPRRLAGESVAKVGRDTPVLSLELIDRFEWRVTSEKANGRV
jgi:hypothetical protein